MGLPLDRPADMLTEVVSSIRERKKTTDNSMDLVKQAAGSKYREGWGPKEPQVENIAHEWRTNMVPNMVDGNPVLAGVRSGSLPDDNKELNDLRMAMDCWSQSQNLAELLLLFADDQQFNFSAAVVSTEIIPIEPGAPVDMDEVIGRGGKGYGLNPRVHRVSPWRFFKDMQSINRTGPGYVGHISIEYKDDLAKEKLPSGGMRYDKRSLDQVVVDDEVRTLLREIGIDIGGSGIDRDQVVMYQFYCPQDGKMYTLASSPTSGGGKSRGTYLCKSTPWRGLRTGPYVMGGIYSLPDQTYPLAPLAVIHELSLEINRHRSQMSDDAGTAKKLMLIDADPQAIGLMQSALNGTILGIPGLKNAAMEVKTGGVDVGQAQFVELLTAIVEKTVGLTQNSSGETTGGTATEADILQKNRNGRVQWCQKRFQEFTGRILRVVAEQFWNNPRTRQTINHTDPITGENTMGMYEGGDGLKLGIPFEAIHLTIDPYSMQPEDDALMQQQQQQAIELLVANVEVMKANPQVKWRQLIGDTFDKFGMKGREEKYIDWDMLLKAQQLTVPALFSGPPGLLSIPGTVGGMPGQLPMPGQPMPGGAGPAMPPPAAPAPSPVSGPPPNIPKHGKPSTSHGQHVKSQAQKRAQPLKMAG